MREGETVSLEGVILQMPRGMKDRLDTPDNANTDIYIFATQMKKQAP
jgi:hypothetical protein